MLIGCIRIRPLDSLRDGANLEKNNVSRVGNFQSFIGVTGDAKTQNNGRTVSTLTQLLYLGLSIDFALYKIQVLRLNGQCDGSKK